MKPAIEFSSNRNGDAGNGVQSVELMLHIQTVAVSEIPIYPMQGAKCISLVPCISEVTKKGRRAP